MSVLTIAARGGGANKAARPDRAPRRSTLTTSPHDLAIPPTKETIHEEAKLVFNRQPAGRARRTGAARVDHRNLRAGARRSRDDIKARRPLAVPHARRPQG